jgi:hypothetical protein
VALMLLNIVLRTVMRERHLEPTCGRSLHNDVASGCGIKSAKRTCILVVSHLVLDEVDA